MCWDEEEAGEPGNMTHIPMQKGESVGLICSATMTESDKVQGCQPYSAWKAKEEGGRGSRTNKGAKSNKELRRGHCGHCGNWMVWRYYNRDSAVFRMIHPKKKVGERDENNWREQIFE